MGKSLRELKEKLMALGGRTIEPNHRDFLDLKELIDDMMTVRENTLSSDTGGDYSGSTCATHNTISNYGLSEGDVDELSIKNCACNTVTDSTPFCSSRTGVDVCRCNGRTSWNCSCEYRTACTCNTVNTCTCNTQPDSSFGYTCTCQSRTRVADCQGKVIECTCRSRTKPPSGGAYCDCYNRVTCACNQRSSTPACSCNTQYQCTCQNRTDTVYGDVSDCPSRTTCTSDTYVGPDCSSRTGVSPCQCDTRCACNVKNAFE